MIVSEVVREVRQHLGGDRARRDKIASSTATTVTLTYGTTVSPGSVIEVSTGELLYVWEYNSGTKTATVERAYAGSTQGNLTAGAVLTINPRFAEVDILAAIQHEIRALSSEGLYQRKTATVTYDSTENKWDTSAVTDMLSPYALSYDPTDSRTVYVFDFVQRDGFLRPMLEPDATTTTLHYRAPFVAFTATTDDLETVCKIPETAHDVVALGAASRLLIAKEALRVDVIAQQVGRKAEDVPATSNARLSQFIQGERDRRLGHEVRRLREVWPARMV